MASVASVARWLVGCVSLRENPESGGMKHAILHIRPPPGQSPRRSNWQSCFFRVSVYSETFTLRPFIREHIPTQLQESTVEKVPRYFRVLGVRHAPFRTERQEPQAASYALSPLDQC